MAPASRRVAPLVVLAALLLPLVPQGAAPAGNLDLSEDVPAGVFRAYKIRLLAPSVIEFGGWYTDAVTSQPVLPVLAYKQNPNGLWGTCTLSYDRGMSRHDYAVRWASEGLVARQGEDFTYYRGYYCTTANRVEPGVYTIILATAPAEGHARLLLRVWGSAEVVASDAGASLFARGFDASARAYDVEIRHPGLNAYDPVFYRAWSYTGADIPFHVRGHLFAYRGEDYGPARLVGPDGAAYSKFVLGEAGGSWRAEFPEERWERPLCEPGGEWSCRMFHDRERHPPFVIAADVAWN